MRTAAYLDASAIVKLVLHEPESLSLLRWYHESERVVTSRIGVIETSRAVRRREHDSAHLAAVIDRLEVFELDLDVERRASVVRPASLRTLDAVHIATALAIPGLDSFVTYDDRQADASLIDRERYDEAVRSLERVLAATPDDADLDSGHPAPCARSPVTGQ